MKISSNTMATRPTMEPSVAAAITPALEAALETDCRSVWPSWGYGSATDKRCVTILIVWLIAAAFQRSFRNLGWDKHRVNVGSVTGFDSDALASMLAAIVACSCATYR